VGRARKQRCIDPDFFRGFAHDLVVGNYEACFDCGLCLGAAFKKASLDEETINASALRGHRSIPCRGSR
jgi:hypothetical protein